jgi:Secretion system C-terminal sorting domain
MRLVRNTDIEATGRQFVGIALLCLCFLTDARAQLTWDVTQSDTSIYYVLSGTIGHSISCYGNTCTALTQAQIDSIGYSLTRSILWRTDDAGLTWKKQDPGLPWLKSRDGHIFPINKIDQIDSLRAIAVGYGGLILATNDGGNTWEKQPCPVTSDLIDIDCFNSDEGIIIGGSNTILTRSEAGWRVAPFAPLAPYFCHSYGEGKYRVLSDYNFLYTTLDDWSTVDSISFPQWTPDSLIWLNIATCRFGEGDTIIVGCGSYPGPASNGSRPKEHWPSLIRTFDGGNNWQVMIDSASRPNGFSNLSPIFDHTIISATIIDSATGTVHPGLILVSTDLGATWQEDTLQFNKKFASPIMADAIGFTSSGSMVGSFSFNDYLPMGISDSGFFARLNPSSNSGVKILESSSQEFPIYPNPAENVLNIESFDGSIRIDDPLGRSYAVPRNGDALDISSLPSGVYFVSDGHSRAKFVKE